MLNFKAFSIWLGLAFGLARVSPTSISTWRFTFTQTSRHKYFILSEVVTTVLHSLSPFYILSNMAFRNNETRQKEFKIPQVQKHKTQFEENFPFLDRRTPAKSMTVPEAQKLLKKVRTVANWLDNAVPYSPIPIGLDTFVVRGFRTHQHRACCEDHICLMRRCRCL